MERVRWEKERAGFLRGRHEEQMEKIVKNKSFNEVWKRFGSNMFSVERFVLFYIATHE